MSRIFTAALLAATIRIAPATDYWVTTQTGFDHLNTVDFEPGDRILLNGGTTFSGTLNLGSSDTGTDGSGNLIAPIIVTSYGTGRATISAGDGAAIVAYNNGGIEIRNLNLVGSGVAPNGITTNTKSGLTFFNDVPGNVKFRHIRIEDIEVSGFGSRGVVIGGYQGDSGYHDVAIKRVIARENRHTGIETYGYPGSTSAITDVRVADCVAYGNTGIPGHPTNTGSGITLSAVTGGVIERCTAHGNGANNVASEGPVGIWAYRSSQIVIQHCESYGNRTQGGDGGGFDLDIGTTDSVMQYNYSHDNEGAGFLAYGTAGANGNARNIVRYNVSENDGRDSGSGAASGINVTSNVRDLQVYGNTIVMSPSGSSTTIPAIKVTGYGTRPDKILVSNNIFVTTGGARLVNLYDIDSVTFAGNNYWSSGGAFAIRDNTKTYSSLSAWRSGTGREKLGGQVTGHSVDPGFQSLVFSRAIGGTTPGPLLAYRLRPDSPLIDRGLDLAAIFGIDPGPRDLFGGRVAQGAAYEIGAHEFAIDPPGLLGFTFDPATGAARIRYQSELGVAFTVRRSNNMNGNPGSDWDTVSTTQTGDGSVMEYVDFPPAGACHFYVLQRAE